VTRNGEYRRRSTFRMSSRLAFWQHLGVKALLAVKNNLSAKSAVLYILRIAGTDYGKESTLLVKSSCAPDGDCRSPNTQGNSNGRPRLWRAVSGPQPTVRPVTGVGRRMEQLLIAVSVYRVAADRNALLFQLGEPDVTAALASDGRGPSPPYQTPADLPELIVNCIAAELICPASRTADPAEVADSWVVDPWLAGQLHRQLEAVGRRAELVTAHRRAAEYWQWRAAAWPQERREDMDDLLEARHHLFVAGDAEQASTVTHVVCARLHAWGDFGREAVLIGSTLDTLCGGTARSASWMHRLGAIYQARREHEEARRCYSAAVEVFTALGDHRGAARGHHSLGVLAQAQGDYRRAERHYRRSSIAEKKAAGRTPAAGSEDDVRRSVAAPAEPTSPATAAGAACTTPGPAGTNRPSVKTAAGRADPAAANNTSAPPSEGISRQASRWPGPLTLAAITRAAAAVADTTRAAARRVASTRACEAGPLRRQTGSILLVLGLTAAAIAVTGALLVRPGVHLRTGGSLRPGALSPAPARLVATSWVVSQVRSHRAAGPV
jgi:tetratricopeptide (TPR) repeat protein